jgi:hypothetical protein
MKRIAFILLLIFTLVQAGPAIASLVSPATTVFMMDEEKGEEKHKEPKKENKKDFLRQILLSADFEIQSLKAVHQSEKIHPSPCIEKVSPPPNFC